MKITDFFAIILIFAFVVAMQALGGAYGSDFANHPDEPAHFVTGLMVHDYLVDALGSPPKAFASAYYAHYPKVAFGHWPPAYYAIQAAWYCVFGPTKAAAVLLSGVIAAAITGGTVRYIVLDDFKPRGQDVEPHHHLLRRVLDEQPERFPRVGTFAMAQGGRRVEGAVRCYENRLAGGGRPDGRRSPAEAVGAGPSSSATNREVHHGG